MSESNSLFINNQWKPGSGASFSSHDPATGEKLWEGKEASPSDVNEAILHAKQAFSSWSSLPIDERSRFLTDFADVLCNSQQELAKTISQETGKPLWESMNEVEAMINKVDISLEAYGRRCAGMIRDLPHARLITRHRPHGVLSVFGPYNFPGHLPNGHIIPALLAGNTIVFKPSELTPLVAEKTLRIWEKVNLPPGVLNLVQGGRETGKTIIHHSDIQGILFTGSYSTGLYLSQLFGSQPSKILALEMGGNNPLIIGDIRDFRSAAYIVLQSAYLSSGQRCTCARRLIIPNTQIGEKLLMALMEMIHALSIGPYHQQPEPFMGPVISEKHALQILETQEVLKSKGGIPLIEMQHLKPGTGFISPGLMDVTAIRERPDEEIFGPFLQVIRVNQFEEAIHEANQTKFGLAAGLLSQSQKEYDQFFQHSQAGIVNWNVPLTGASSTAPFGGIKCSGNYRPSAYYAADYCAYPVASMESSELKMPARFSPGINLKTTEQ
jgi:succinylglutamic semialdehyde dehydrogenase